MNVQTDSRIGNMLGAARAEADSQMLEQAFLETNDFRALKDTDHYSFIVGRRGTGKTAFFLQLVKEFLPDNKIFSYQVKPEEHEALALLGVFRKLHLKSYNSIRSVSRVLWRIAMLISVANDLSQHWRYRTSPEVHWLRRYLSDKKRLLAFNELQRCAELLYQVSLNEALTEQIPNEIATTYELPKLEAEIRRGLERTGVRAVFLFDGLDEGWTPDQEPTAVLGGLAIAVAGFSDRDMPIQGKLFVRDNIFRLLAALDKDFSRHIEGNTLRLNWTQDSLLNLVANRLRVALKLSTMENNVRVWNRFAHRELRDRDGFLRCLQHTLYRPRDLLVLLNQAATWAAREGRQEIIETDIEGTSKEISWNRLEDLLKEYEGVFPGLSVIVKHFSGVQPFQTTESVMLRLDALIDKESYSSAESSDIAILGTSSQIIDALSGVGFLGLEDSITGAILFCHDGAMSRISDQTETHRIMVHPCYWKALDITDASISRDVLVELYDDYKAHVNSELGDMRTRRLGQLVSELPSCPEGQKGSHEYEQWVLRTCQILFAGSLANFQLHPAPDGIQRRDVLATNQAERGFWRRVLEDYKCRQVIFEAKNFANLGLEDFRQALSYSGNQYGQLVFLVNRINNEGMDNKVRGWIKEMWYQHNVMIMPLPTVMLTRCLKKIRNPKRRDYTEQVLSRRLDTFERDYLSLNHTQKSRKRTSRKRQA